MRLLSAALACLMLSACGLGSVEDPNEVFVDAFLNKHLAKIETDPEFPKAVVSSIRKCARPKLLVAAKKISDGDKTKILNGISGTLQEFEIGRAMEAQLSGEEDALTKPVNSILGDCLVTGLFDAMPQGDPSKN